MGIVGLVGAFKDTLELIDLIVYTGNLGREFQLLITKLDIEKTLLLRWVDAVGRKYHTGAGDSASEPPTFFPNGLATKATSFATSSSLASAISISKAIGVLRGVDRWARRVLGKLHPCHCIPP